LIAGGIGYLLSPGKAGESVVKEKIVEVEKVIEKEIEIESPDSAIKDKVIYNLLKEKLAEKSFEIRNPKDIDSCAVEFARTYLGKDASPEEIAYVRDKIILPRVSKETINDIERWRIEKSNYIIRIKGK